MALVPKKFLTNLDLSHNELLNARVQVLASAPGSPKEGWIYFDSTKHEFGYYSGSEWIYGAVYILPEASSTVLGGIKLKGDIEGGEGKAPKVTNLHLAGNTEVGHKLTKLTKPTEAEDAANKEYVDEKIYTLPEASSSVLGGVKLKGDLEAGEGKAPQVTNLHLAGDTKVNHKLTELSAPTEAKDAANKEYVDNKANGLTWKAPAYIATTEALPANTVTGEVIEANANGTLTIDGKEPAVGKRVLVKNQAETKNDGIYEMLVKGEAGAKFKMTRAADAKTTAGLQDATLFVEVGTVNEGHAFNQSATVATVGTTAQTWVEIQNATAVVGDGTYTERSGNKIELKPFSTNPTVPAEGAVSAASTGASRKVSFAINGNNSATEFTLTHNLNTRLVVVESQENSAGTPTLPVELGWEPTSANAIKVSFAVKPAAAEAFFVTILG